MECDNLKFIYVDNNKNAEVVFEVIVLKGTLLSEVDILFKEATGIDPQKAKHIGVYWHGV